MYPDGQLVELAERKAILQARIDVRRWECAAAAVQLCRPVATIDRGVEMWHRVAPFAKLLAVPAGILLTRVLAKRRGDDASNRKRGKIAAIITAVPLIVRGVRLFGHVRAMHAARQTARP